MADQDQKDEHEVDFDPGEAPPPVPNAEGDEGPAAAALEDDDHDDHDEDEDDAVDEDPPPAASSPPPAAQSARAGSRSSSPPPDSSERSRSRPSSEPPPREGGSREERRSRIDGLLRESMRRAIEKGLEAGVGTFSRADSAIRGVVDEAKIPRELLGYVFSQVDETKNVVVGAVAKEVRDFLDSTDLAAELQRALTSLSFEIKTEIRFIPNDAGEMKPRVKARVAPTRVRRPCGTRSDEGDGDEDEPGGRRPSARRSRGDG